MPHAASAGRLRRREARRREQGREPPAQARSAGRGREAERPREIPKAGWKDILYRVKDRISQDELSIIAAGVAFYALLAIFPALTALVGIYGLVFDPSDVSRQISSMSGVLPGQAASLLTTQLQHLTSSSNTALGLGVAGGIIVALWSASSGIKTLMQALNVAYHEEEKRGFIKLTAIALGLTLAGVAAIILILALLVVLPAAAKFIGAGSVLNAIALWVRWPIVALVVWAGTLVMYRYGPSRDHPKWSWASWGAVASVVIWLIGSALFSWYVSAFGSYNKTYGSMGAMVVLLMWFLLSAYAVLIGAELNSELERQTRKDTTIGEPRPLGQRNAYAADTVGKSHDET